MCAEPAAASRFALASWQHDLFQPCMHMTATAFDSSHSTCSSPMSAQHGSSVKRGHCRVPSSMQQLQQRQPLAANYSFPPAFLLCNPPVSS